MKLAVKFYSQVDNPEEIPGIWPAEVIELKDSDLAPSDEYTIMTLDEFNQYKIDNRAEYDAWLATIDTTSVYGWWVSSL